MSDDLYGELPGIDRANNIPGIDYVLKTQDNEGNYVVDEVIKMSEKQPINDHLHKHTIELDGDIMGDSVSVRCAKCPIGWYIPIQEAKNIGLMQ